MAPRPGESKDSLVLGCTLQYTRASHLPQSNNCLLICYLLVVWLPSLTVALGCTSQYTRASHTPAIKHGLGLFGSLAWGIQGFPGHRVYTPVHAGLSRSRNQTISCYFVAYLAPWPVLSSHYRLDCCPSHNEIGYLLVLIYHAVFLFGF